MEITHIANPVEVCARVIRDVIRKGNDCHLTLDDGTEYVAGPSMTVRHIPETGDYLVRQEDGYEYLNPKDVFERKYSAAAASTICQTSGAGAQIGRDIIGLRMEALSQAVRNNNPSTACTIKAAEVYLAFLTGAQSAPEQRGDAVAPSINLSAGERYIGAITGADGKGHHVILMADEINGATWGEATKWATDAGGDLPNRVEQALLFANFKDEFKEEAYWSNTQHAVNDTCAWYQIFLYGSQSDDFKSSSLRARAVRRLVIQ